MAKQPVISEINNVNNSHGVINTNFNNVKESFTNTLSRDGSTPNQMQADLDMNSNDLLNVKDLTVQDLITSTVLLDGVLLEPGFTWEGEWVTAHEYFVNNVMKKSGVTYVCVIRHVSGSFASDLGLNRWEVFVETEVPAGPSLELGETDTTAYRGDRGKIAYDHSQEVGNPHSTAVSDVSGLQTSLDGKQPLATVLTNTTASFTTDKETKLFNIETAATANSSDASLRDRSTHTGTQLSSTISDLSAAVASTASVTDNTAKVTNATHTGDVTGSTALTIANNVVSNAKASDVPTATIKGRVTAGTGDPEDLTATQATSILNVVTSGSKGLAPASGGGTTNFLRADGSWASPGGGGIAEAPSDGTPYVRKDAAWLRVPQVAAYVKTVDTTKTTDTTMANDPHLVNIPLAANATYRIEMQIKANAGSVSDGKLAVVVQSGLSGAAMSLAQDLANEIAQYFVFGDVNAFSGAGAGTSRLGMYVGIITTSAASGTIALQWAQNTSSAEVTTFEKGSYIILTRLA